MRVWPTLVAGPHRRWPLASRIIAGRSGNCCLSSSLFGYGREALPPMTGLEMHYELRTQHKRIADGAAAARPDNILHIRRYREPALDGNLVIRLKHCLSGRARNIVADGAVNEPRGNDVVATPGHESLIAHASPQEIGHGVDARLGCNRGLAPHRQALLAVGTTVAVQHLLK